MSHEDTVLRALQDGGDATAPQLAVRTGLYIQRVRAALRALEGAGLVHREWPERPRIGRSPTWRTGSEAEEEVDVLDSLRTLRGRRTVLELAEDTGRLVPEVRAACERLVRRGLAERSGSGAYRAVAREEAA